MAATNRAERLWVGGTAGLALLIVVIGWFFLISPQRDETADVQSQTADAQTQNVTLQARISRLDDQKKNWKVYAAALAKARQALPDRSDLSIFLRDVQAIAGRTSTRVTSLNVGEPTALTPVAAPSPAPTPSATTGSTPPGGVPAAGGGVFAIPIDASLTGTPTHLSNFLTRLQSVQPRAVLVTSVTRNAGEGGVATMQVKLDAFVAPGATPASATPSASAS